MKSVTYVVEQRARRLSAKVKDPKRRKQVFLALVRSLTPIEQIKRMCEAC